MACAFPNISKYAQPNILRVNLKEFSKCNHFLNQKVTGDTRNCKCSNIEQNKVLEELLGHATSMEEADSNVLGQDPPSDQSIGCSLPPQMLPYLHTHTVICVLFQKGNAVYDSCDLKNQWENIWTDMLFKKSTEHRVRAKNNFKQNF